MLSCPSRLSLAFFSISLSPTHCLLTRPAALLPSALEPTTSTLCHTRLPYPLTVTSTFHDCFPLSPRGLSHFPLAGSFFSSLASPHSLAVVARHLPQPPLPRPKAPPSTLCATAAWAFSFIPLSLKCPFLAFFPRFKPLRRGWPAPAGGIKEGSGAVDKSGRDGWKSDWLSVALLSTRAPLILHLATLRPL